MIINKTTSQSHVDECIRCGQQRRQATVSESLTRANLIWTMMQPGSLVRERQLSHWDPVCHQPHLTHKTLPRAVHLELSLDIWLWLYCATPSMSPHRIKPAAAPSDILFKTTSTLCWEIWCSGWRGLELYTVALSKKLSKILPSGSKDKFIKAVGERSSFNPKYAQSPYVIKLLQLLWEQYDSKSADCYQVDSCGRKYLPSSQHLQLCILPAGDLQFVCLHWT